MYEEEKDRFLDLKKLPAADQEQLTQRLWIVRMESNTLAAAIGTLSSCELEDPFCRLSRATEHRRRRRRR